MWMEFPPSDKIRELRERVTRLEHAQVSREETLHEEGTTESVDAAMIEDAVDIINYAAFLIKQIERGMYG